MRCSLYRLEEDGEGCLVQPQVDQRHIWPPHHAGSRTIPAFVVLPRFRQLEQCLRPSDLEVDDFWSIFGKINISGHVSWEYSIRECGFDLENLGAIQGQVFRLVGFAWQALDGGVEKASTGSNPTTPAHTALNYRKP